jgi:hypothetical protein
VVLAGTSPQKAGFLVHNWSITPAEARADNDRSGVYLYHTLDENILLASDLESNAMITGAKDVCLTCAADLRYQEWFLVKDSPANRPHHSTAQAKTTQLFQSFQKTLKFVQRLI